MIRLTLFYMMIAFGLVYVWRNWFAVVCGLLLNTALLQHEDFPRSLFGITGVNPWNVLFACAVLAWLLERPRRPAEDKLPINYFIPWAMYALFLSVCCLRAVLGNQAFHGYEQYKDPATLLTDWLINPLKFMILLILVYEGARTRFRIELGVATIILVGVVYAVLTVRCMPLASLASGTVPLRARGAIERQVGLHANDIAKVLGATVWALVGSCPWWWRMPRLRWFAVTSILVVGLGLMLCYSRAGYVAAAVVGLGLGVLRMRRLLLIMPVVAVVAAFAFPAVMNRIDMGVGEVDAGGDTTSNWDTISAGRLTNLWPPVIEAIMKSPLIGQGRLAILRTDVYYRIRELEKETPSHPHNSYLEVLLDGGIVGLVVVLAGFTGVFWTTVRLLRNRTDPLISVLGCVGFAHVVTVLVSAMSGTAFFLAQSSAPLLASAGLTLRVWHDCWCQPQFVPMGRHTGAPGHNGAGISHRSGGTKSG